MDVIFERAKTSEVPAVANNYEQPEVRLLVSVCRELQRAVGDEPFYLSCRTAGQLLGVDHSTASRWLFLLRADGILCEQEKGGKQGARFRASRYFYVADEECDEMDDSEDSDPL